MYLYLYLEVPMKVKYIGLISGSNNQHIVNIDVHLRSDDPEYCSIKCHSIQTHYTLITKAVKFAKKFKTMLDAVKAT